MMMMIDFQYYDHVGNSSVMIMVFSSSISHHTLTQMRCKIMLTVLETDHISIQASPSVVA